jgi:hypothetical protein
MDGNRQEGKLLTIKSKALKWVKKIRVPLRITLTCPNGKWDDCDITFMITMIIK